MALAVAAGVSVATLALVQVLGWRRVLFGSTVLFCSIPSVKVWTNAPLFPLEVQSVASPYVGVTALTLVLILGLIFIPDGPSLGKVSWRLMPLLTYLLAGWLFWPQTQIVASGVLHILTCCAAFLLGYRLADYLDPSTGRARLGAAMLFGITIGFLVIPSAYQYINGIGVDGYGLRTGAVYGHPSTVGKVATVFIAVCLPLLTSKDRKTSNLGLLTIAGAILATLPSLSRANLVAIALVLVGWIALSLRERGTRTVIAGVTLGTIAALPFIRALIDRFLVDPTGHERPLLLEAAWRQLPEFWQVGTGPNNYTTVMSQVEGITASTGLPVHNALLLVLSEIGVIGILVLLPMLIPILTTAISGLLPSEGKAVLHKRSLLLLLIGVLFIGWTGWGILRAPTAQLVCFLVAAEYQLASGSGRIHRDGRAS